MKILGLMSGTSLDGLDLALCDINEQGFKLLAAETYPYDESWTSRLATLENATAYEYALADAELGHYFGRMVNRFRQQHPGEIDAIASHGHTIFHQPHLGLTTQIADGDAIAAETGLPVVYRFRNLDVAMGGQGAPLVPIGDRLLFGQYDACLNLGGIANISYEVASAQGQRREAYDICPCNMALNLLARREGQRYDRDGALARQGTIDTALLAQMNALSYYRLPLPKTLGKEWFVANFKPLLDKSISTAALMATTAEHIAIQIAAAAQSQAISSMLITGGGAKNQYLAARIQHHMPQCRLTIPDADIIDYKEAIIFALLGYLRLKHHPNCLSSVTGAQADNCGGCIAGLVL